MQQIFAMSLRALNLGSKFVVFFLLAKYAEPEQLSLFGLYWTSVVSLSALMGLELYGHTIRTFLSETTLGRQRHVVGRHFGGILLMNAVLMPLTLLLINLSLERLAPFLLMLGLHLLAELITQDNSRLLIGLGRPLQAIILNTIRGAFWAAVAVGYIFIAKSNLNIHVLISIWVCFSLFSLILSLVLLSNSLEYLPKPEIEINWISSALKVSVVLILCALSFRALVSGDKYLAEYLYGAKEAAYYIFYATVAFSVTGLIESGVSAWYYPKLVRCIRSSMTDDFFEIRSRFFILNFASSVILSLAVLLVFYLAAKYYLDLAYLVNFPIMILCILGVAVYSCSMPDHYSIYGLEKDWVILFINFTAAILFLFCTYIFSKSAGVDGIAMSFFIGLTYIAFSRRFAAYKLLRSSFLVNGAGK